MLKKLSNDQSKSIRASDNREPTTAKLTIPIFAWDEGYARRCVDVRLSGSQAATLKAIQLGLENRGAQLENGKYVANAVDAIRWMLENINTEEGNSELPRRN